jgi:hypothetical protein
MTKARDIADLLDATGDVKSTALDNVPASDDASALTTGTLDNARLPSNISDTGTEGTKIASGTTAQRGTTAGQLRFNTTTGLAEYYTGTEFKAIDTPPIISSINTSLIDSNSGTTTSITIIGDNFTSNTTVSILGTAGGDVTPVSTTFNSSTSITIVVTDSDFANAYEPYSVKVTNVSGLNATLSNAINVDTTVAWQTASGSLGTIPIDATGNHFTVVATDADSDTITYSVVSGALPNGISLDSSTGVISGDPDDVLSNTTYNFTIRASTTSANADRAFSMVVSAPINIEYLVVAGGGGTGSGNRGGGGAGGFRTATSSFNSGTVITGTVGGGGTSAGAGSDSSISASGFTTYTSTGGGFGGSGQGGSGGSGGGSGYNTTSQGQGNTPATNPSQGNNGAGQNTSGSGYGAGGGGGAGSNGSSGTNSSGGNGGSGKSNSITGSAVTYAGGGGGAVEFSGSTASGGSGGGGNGGNGSGGEQSGTANTGGGGGASYVGGGNGGSGIVILRLPTASYSGTTTGSPTVTTDGTDTVIKFTGTGTYTV